MALTRDFKETVMARAQRDPEFRGALLIEATDAFLGGDIDTGKALLRDYLNATAALPTIADELNLNEPAPHARSRRQSDPEKFYQPPHRL